MPAAGLLWFRNVSTTVQIAEFSSNAPTPNLATNYKLQPHSCADPRCPGRLGKREKLAFLSILLENRNISGISQLTTRELVVQLRILRNFVKF